MPAAARPSARTLALVAGSAVVVGALVVWWVTRLRSFDEEAEPEPGAVASLRDLQSQLRTLRTALDRMARDQRSEGEPPPPANVPARPSQAPERETPPPGGPEEASVPHLTALRRAYEAATDPRARDRILDRFTYAHSFFAETTGDLQFLPFLRDVIATSESAEQRKYAVIALHGVGHPEVVDLLADLVHAQHAEVRFYAAEALPWVTGAQRDRARRLLAEQLDHTDPEVRRIVALALGVVIGDPAHGEAMLRRLTVETHEEVLEALVFGVRRLLPRDGDARIRALLPGLDRARAVRIESLLR